MKIGNWLKLIGGGLMVIGGLSGSAPAPTHGMPINGNKPGIYETFRGFIKPGIGNIKDLFKPQPPGQLYDPNLELLRKAFETNPTLINTLEQLLVRPNPGRERIRQTLMDGVKAEGISVSAAFLDQFIKDLLLEESNIKAGKALRAIAELREEASRLMDRNKRVQESLKRAGHDPGTIDGIIGPRTKAALRGFQHARSLAETGVLDPATADALAGFDIPARHPRFEKIMTRISRR